MATRSLKQMCQDCADETKGPRPTTIIDNTNAEALELLRLATKVNRTLAACFPWQILRKETTFTSVATETQTSALASDFDRFVPETFWNRTDKIFVSGPITPVEWHSLKALSYDDTQHPKMMLRADTMLIVPTLAASKTLAWEYITNKIVDITATGTPKTDFTIDTDIPLVNDELIIRGMIWEWLSAEGLPNEMAAESYESYFNYKTKNDQPNARVLISGDIFGGARHFTGEPKAVGSGSIT